MNDFAQLETASAAFRLPAWWRYVLIAMATVILCSCSAPAVYQTAAFQDDGAPAELAHEEVDPAAPVEQEIPEPQPTNAPAAPLPASVESRSLAATPMTMASDLTANCPTCNAAGCSPNCSDPYGPVVGPSDEYLCDGGDFGPPVGVKHDWTIEGLGEEDAVAHYDTVDGRVIVTPSNRVCIYAPRFAAVRRVVSPVVTEQPVFVNAVLEEQQVAGAHESQPVATSLQRTAVAIDLGQLPPSLFRQRQQAGGLVNLQATMDAYNSLAVYANLSIIRTGEVSGAEKALVEKAIQQAITLTGTQAPQVVLGVKMAQAATGIKQPGIIYQTDGPDSPRLRLLKLASCGNAQSGEEVEFTLRYDNIGDQVIGNVTIVDNLSTRFEYVAESAKSSVDANFRADPNDTGSLILRWEIKESVKPGDGGILRFRVKVR